MFQVELAALPDGFEVGGEREKGVKSAQLGSKGHGFPSLPKEAEVEGFLQPDLKSQALEPAGKCKGSCLPVSQWDRKIYLFILSEHLIHIYTVSCAQHCLSAFQYLLS